VTEARGGPVAVWKADILPANVHRIRSLANVLPNGCSLLWSPVFAESVVPDLSVGSWRWTVFRDQATGKGNLREEGKALMDVPTERQWYETCWCCDFVLAAGEGSTPDVAWDSTDIWDWDVSSENLCEGQRGTQKWVEELEEEEE